MRSKILKKDSFKKRTLILSFLVLLLCISVGYAFISQTLKVNTSAKITKNTWDVHFENIVTREGSVSGTSTIGSDKTSITSVVELKEPGDFYEIRLDIVNKGSMDARVDSIVKTTLTDKQKTYLNYIVTYSDYEEIKENDLLKVGEKETIRILVEKKDLLDITKLPQTDENLTLVLELNYAQSSGKGKERSKTSLYNQVVKEAQLDTGINFGASSSDTNGKGVYTLSKTSNTAYPVYYYRGAVENNNVLFGNFCWKMIRTTSTGGIKLIYNGTPTDGTCNNTGEATEIGKSSFNATNNDSKYVGYMYDNNTVNSTIKDVIDEWFADNLVDYLDMLEDTPFYNERDYVAGAFAPHQRIWGLKTGAGNYADTVPNTTIKLGASDVEDIFTVSNDIGNGKLTYPVGLLTSDEAVLAGARGFISNEDAGSSNCYLYNRSASSYTMSPSSGNSMILLTVKGSLTFNYLNASAGVSPVISLQANSTFSSGNGTSNFPYVIAN